MTDSNVKCPKCGHVGSGKYCADCGAALSASCGNCGSSLSAGARFCHVCGAAAGDGGPARAAAPTSGSASPLGANAGWIVAAALAVVVIVVAATRFSGGMTGAPPPPVPAAGPPTASDISQMTPREAADRLFDRTMIANENGFPDSVAFFGPMAVQSYAMVGELDVDARYHVGIIQALLGGAEAVAAQRDSLRQEAPDHLLTWMLEFTHQTLTGDEASVRAAYEGFLERYDTEIAKDIPEYRMHGRAIEGFRQEALTALGRS